MGYFSFCSFCLLLSLNSKIAKKDRCTSATRSFDTKKIQAYLKALSTAEEFVVSQPQAIKQRGYFSFCSFCLLLSLNSKIAKKDRCSFKNNPGSRWGFISLHDRYTICN